MSHCAYVRGSRGYISRSTGDADEVSVQRLIDGIPVRANYQELDAAMAQLEAAGVGTRLIAERLGVSMETVYRHRYRRAS